MGTTSTDVTLVHHTAARNRNHSLLGTTDHNHHLASNKSSLRAIGEYTPPQPKKRPHSSIQEIPENKLHSLSMHVELAESLIVAFGILRLINSRISK